MILSDTFFGMSLNVDYLDNRTTSACHTNELYGVIISIPADGASVRWRRLRAYQHLNAGGL